MPTAHQAGLPAREPEWRWFHMFNWLMAITFTLTFYQTYVLRHCAAVLTRHCLMPVAPVVSCCTVLFYEDVKLLGLRDCRSSCASCRWYVSSQRVANSGLTRIGFAGLPAQVFRSQFVLCPFG